MPLWPHMLHVLALALDRPRSGQACEGRVLDDLAHRRVAAHDVELRDKAEERPQATPRRDDRCPGSIERAYSAGTGRQAGIDRDAAASCGLFPEQN